MKAMRLGESCLHRVVVIGGATAVVVIALLVAKPFYSAMTSSADVGRSVASQAPAIETVLFVASPTIETNAKFFFGTGDASNGYYAERQAPTRP